MEENPVIGGISLASRSTGGEMSFRTHLRRTWLIGTAYYAELLPQVYTSWMEKILRRTGH